MGTGIAKGICKGMKIKACVRGWVGVSVGALSGAKTA